MKCDLYKVAFEVERMDCDTRIQTDSTKFAITMAKKWFCEGVDICINAYYTPIIIDVGSSYTETKKLYQWSTEENPVVFIGRHYVNKGEEDKMIEVLGRLVYKYYDCYNTQFINRNEIIK